MSQDVGRAAAGSRRRTRIVPRNADARPPAGADKEWKLVAEANFDEACGDWTRYRNRRVARVVRAAFRASIVVGGVAALAAAGARPRGFTRRAGPDEVGKV